MLSGANAYEMQVTHVEEAYVGVVVKVRKNASVDVVWRRCVIVWRVVTPFGWLVDEP